MATASSTMMDGPLVEPHPRGLTRAGNARLEAIDMLRGLVIAIMVLDHVRDFFMIDAFKFDPTDPVQSYPLLYLTRWITHLCAPTFVLLSGVSIYFQQAGGKTGASLSRFLVTRGLWLVFLELTVVMFAWNFGLPFFLLQVIWAIGWSMVLMAAIVHFGPRIVLGIGIALVALCPFALPQSAPVSDPIDILRHMLFGTALIAGAPVFIAYAILPWLGVMAIGFGLGPVFAMDAKRRRRTIAMIAGALLALFIVMRTINGFGNPQPWTSLGDPVRTAMSFFNVAKYPPSPDFVAVTLGLSLLVFLAIDHWRWPAARILGDFGRTPLFTYLAHLYIAHLLMLGAAFAVGHPDAAIGPIPKSITGQQWAGWGWSLGVIYGVWLLVLAMLVPLSRWMADLKRRRRDWWLSYI